MVETVQESKIQQQQQQQELALHHGNTDQAMANLDAATRSAESESYLERKSQLAQTGQLIPAFKHSSLKAPINRNDRKGNQIGFDRKKYHITYIDQIEKRPLVQVHCVESYKKYNAEDPIQGDTPCCSIF